MNRERTKKNEPEFMLENPTISSPLPRGVANYFRINAMSMGRLGRTLIIANEDAYWSTSMKRRIVNGLGKLNRTKRAYAVLMLCATTAITLPAQTFTTLVSFDGVDGANPFAGLVQGADGNLYGTTYAGGADNAGTVFKITPSGTLTTLYSFCSQTDCADGEYPEAALIQAANGDFYGTTVYGGSNCNYPCGGTVFKITPSGNLTTLYSFCSQTNCTDGQTPVVGLVQATNGDLYGTTTQGGTNGGGTVFKITPSGTLTTLYSFCAQSGCTDGETPEATLIQATNGDFYGTTAEGGANADCSFYLQTGCGTIFKITPSGTLTTVYSFCSQVGGDGVCADGAEPVGPLVQATNGEFYGTTVVGGANVYVTVFKVTAGGTLTTLYSFCPQGSQWNCPDGDGAAPDWGLVQATNGDLYGTTQFGGANSQGTIFKITPTGTLTTLYSFCPLKFYCPYGNQPLGGLVQDTNGHFYGTSQGGTGVGGTVFRLSVGLGPFVKTLPTFGKVGAVVKVLGTDMTGAVSVTFNGTPAAIIFVSHTEIVTTVPAGATTGDIQVTTSGRTLVSNVPFRVFP
jgi:uncharacterized repeat protein (TIGR03803 family)